MSLKINENHIQESFQNECNEQQNYMVSLLDQLSDVQKVHQGLNFDFSSANSAADARLEMQNVRERLSEYGAQIETALAETDRLCHDGAEVLTPEQFSALKEHRQKLMNTYNHLVKHTDAILDQLDIATSLLIEFSTKSSEFHSWIFEKSRSIDNLRMRSGDPTNVNESRREAKALHEDILSRNGEPRALAHLANKIDHEVRRYIDELKQLDPNAQHPPLESQQVLETAQLIQEDYERLVKTSVEFGQSLNRLKNLSIIHDQNMNDVQNWLAELEDGLRNLEDRSLSGSQESLDEKLNKLVELKQMAIENQPKIDAIKDSSKQILTAVAGTDAQPRVELEQDNLIRDMQKRFDRVNNKVKTDIDKLRSEIAEKEGVTQGLDNVLGWLAKTEADLLEPKALPLNPIKLNELKYEHQLKQGELEGQEKVLGDLEKHLQHMRETSPGIVAQEKLDEKLNEAKRKLSFLKANADGLAANIKDSIQGLDEFNNKNQALDKKLQEITDDIEQTSPSDESGMRSLGGNLADVEDDVTELESLEKRLLSIPNVSETKPLVDSLNGTKKLLDKTKKRYNDKLALGEKLNSDKNQFATKCENVKNLLSNIESALDNDLRDKSIDLEKLKSQDEICAQLQDQLRNSKLALNELEQYGAELMMAANMGNKRRSVDFSKKTQEMESVGEISQQLLGLRNRQEAATEAVHQVTQKVHDLQDKRQEWNELQGDLARWVDKEGQHLDSMKNLALDKKVLAALAKDLASAERQRRNKQVDLNNLGNQTRHLTGLTSSPEEAQEVKETQKQLEDDLDQLSHAADDLENRVAKTNDFLDDASSLDRWITSKQRMLNNACAVSADIKLINNQLILLDDLKSEFEDETPKWQKMNETAGEVIQSTDSEPFQQEVVAKADDINLKWKNLEDGIETRKNQLEEAKKLATDFEKLNRDVKSDILNVQEKINALDQMPVDNDEEIADYLKRIEEIQKEIDQLKPSTEHLGTLAKSIENLITDPSMKADVNDKLAGLSSSLTDLSKKLDNAKRAVQSAKIHDDQVQKELNDALGWTKAHKAEFDSLQPISSEPQKLLEQIEAFNPMYDAIMEKESDIMLIRANVAESLRKKHDSALKDKLQTLNRTWDGLVAGAKERKSNLDKAKKLSDEINELKNDVLGTLEKVNAQINAAKEQNEPLDQTQLEEQLHALRPKMDGLIALLRRLEELAPGPDTKKLGREIENLFRDQDALLQELANNAKLNETKNGLRSQFEKEVADAKDLIDAIKLAAGLVADPEKGTTPKLSTDKLNSLIKDFDMDWQRLKRDINSTASKLKPIVDSQEAVAISDTVDNLDNDHDNLKEQLAKALEALHQNEDVVEESLEKQKQLGDDVDELEEVMRSMSPIGRNLQNLEDQLQETEKIAEKLGEKAKEVDLLMLEWKKMADDGIVASSQTNQAQKELGRLNRQIDRQKLEAGNRKRAISATLDQLDKLQKASDDIVDQMSNLLNDQVFAAPVGSELNLLKLQRDALNKLKDGHLKKLNDDVDQLSNEYKDLIRSAAPGVSTADIEDQLNNINDKWHELSGEVEKRDNRIESAIQGLGSYNDAYQALLNWLEETEELVNNQKPPSGDYKVVRAQLQNHEFQMKLIEDKQSSVDGFITMIGKVDALTSDPEQKAQLNAKVDEISSRYNALVEGANNRRQQLQDALMLTSEFAELERPLTQWLDHSNKRLAELGKIATDPEKLHEQINKLQDLQDEIIDKQEPFERLVELNNELAQLIGPDDEAELRQSVNTLVNRYNDLGIRARNCLEDLDEIAKNMKSFLDDTDSLAHWLDKIEDQIQKFDELSIDPEELIKQSEELTQLVLDVTEQQGLVSQVVEDSRELCAHTSGSEAVALQFKVEQLRQRYAQVASEADKKIVELSEAIPLSEDFCAGYDEIHAFIDGCKEDLDNLDQVSLEDQTQLIGQIEAELAHYRGELEALNNKSLQLQHLSTPAKADELAKQTNELNEEFAQVADQVTRKGERLKMAEKNSRQAFDELDYYIDWFGEAKDRIQGAEKPSIDIEFLKGQLRNQRLLNEDISSERAGLRDVIAEASKVARDLNAAIGSQDQVLFGKIDKARKLAEEAAELGFERLNGLEQAYALCTELDDSYTDLSDWLDNMDEELRSCDVITTGMRPEVLMQQQMHNNQMLQAIYGQKPMIAKFERNVAALTDLCADADAKNLRAMADEMIERFHELEEAFKERGQALDDAIKQSARFADRLALFLSNLEGAAGQIRNPEPVSSRPPMLRRQISDTAALLDLLKQKEGAFMALKNDAAQLLAHTKPDDPAAADIAEKISLLDALWDEIQTGAAARSAMLVDTLDKAERFWDECAQCQAAVEDLKKKLDTIHTTNADPNMLQENQLKLQQIQLDMGRTRPAIDSLRSASQELFDAVGEDEKGPVEHHLMNVENGWGTVTDLYAQISNNLGDAIDKSMHFHELLQQLLGWLNEFEHGVAALGPIATTNPEEIRAELDKIDQLRHAIDEQAVMREQLNHSAAELCAGAPLQQVEAVRMPINDLNYRWNRLYSTLNDREQRLERALLDMGQFNQAYEQLSGWIGKTDTALDDIDTKPGNLKHTEIELCKLRVIQNDIHSHLPSYEAIVKAGKGLIKAEPNSAGITQPKLDTLTNQWDSLTDKAEQLWTQLEIAKNEANTRGNEIEKWSLWVDDILAELSSSRPIGGLPETASAQLDDFMVLKADVESKRNQMEDLLQRTEAQLASPEAGQGPDSWLEQKYTSLKKNWSKLKERLVDKDKKLNIALEDAIALQNEMQAMTDWLTEAENILSSAPLISRIPETLEKQIEAHAVFAQDVHEHKEKLADLNNKGTKIQFSCEKKDAIPIKNKLISLRHRFDKVLSRTNDRNKNLDNAMADAQLYFEAYNDLIEWIGSNSAKMNQLTVEPSTGDKIRDHIDEHKAFLEELDYRKPKYETTEKKGRALEEQAPPPEKRQIGKMNEDLRAKWNALNNSSAKRQRSLDEALAQSGKFDEATTELLKWLDKTLPKLEKEISGDKILGDLETVRSLYDEHQKLMEEVNDRRGRVETLKKRAEEILSSSTDPKETKEIQDKLDTIIDGWQRLEDACVQKEQKLSDALNTAVDLDELIHDLQEVMSDKENKLRRLTTLLPDDADEVVAQLEELKKFKDGLQDHKPEFEKAMELGKKIQEKCHPKAALPLADLLKSVEMRWNQLNQLTDDKDDKLKNHLEELRDQDKKIAELMDFIEDKQKNLDFKNHEEEPDALEQVANLMAEHDLFKFELQEKDPEVEDTIKANKRIAIAPAPEMTASTIGSNKRPSIGSKLKLLGPQEKQPRSKRQAKTDALANRWRDIWKHAHDYDEKLKARKAHLEELKRLENFTFDEWRDRYLRWNDHGKARISDLFRRIDKSGTGYVPRKAFIDGVLASKFPTTPLEMARVADEFDKGDGMISAKEFMNALRFDPKKRRAEPKTETERIHEELARESARCTCAHRFPITHVSSEKDRVQYGFGFGSTMKRMVRILRSTVMVRVGGGWEALDEFLIKHDPCRAAGRLNVNLRKDLTPEGAVDTMGEFKTKAMRTPPRQDSGEEVLSYRTKPGPITKIREKTEKSMPMFRKPSYPSRDSPYSSRISSRKNSDVSVSEDSKIPRPSPYSSGLGGSRTNLESPRSESRASDRSDSSASHTRIPSLRRVKGNRPNY